MMKRLFIILFALSMLLLTSCDKYWTAEPDLTYNGEENTELKTDTDKILAKIDNIKPYNEIITETVSIESFLYTIKQNPYYFSIEDFNAQHNIECLRKIRGGMLYSVHKTENDGLIYAFFGGNDNQKSYSMYGWHYVERPLKYKDFKSIKKGVNTIEDIEKIDPAASVHKKSINILNPGILQFEHYLDNGILIVLYKIENGNYVVDEIEHSKKFESDQIGFADGSGFEAKILDMDFKK